MADETTAEDLDALMSGAAKERSHPILTDKQVAEAKAKARAAIEAQRVAAAMKAVEVEETRRLQLEEGLTTGIGYLEEIVKVTIDLPRSSPCINNNGGTRVYWHGHSYDVPRHIANSLSETMFRCWRAEEQADGKSTDQMLWAPRHTAINGSTGAIGTRH